MVQGDCLFCNAASLRLVGLAFLTSWKHRTRLHAKEDSPDGQKRKSHSWNHPRPDADYIGRATRRSVSVSNQRNAVSDAQAGKNAPRPNVLIIGAEPVDIPR